MAHRQLPWLLLALGACTGEVPASKDTAAVDDTDLPDPPVAPETPTVRLRDAEPRTNDDLVAEIVTPDPAVTYRWSWSVDGADRPDLTQPSVPASETTKGQRWTVSVVAARSGAESAPATASVEVLNSAPTATLTLDPAAPTAEQAIVAAPVGLDADGDAVTFRLQWTVGGVVTALTADTLPPGSAAKSMVVSVRAIPSDGEEDGAPVTAAVTVINAAPRVTGTTILPAAPTTRSTITGSATRSDPDGDTTTLTYTWLVDGAPIAGITTGSLPEQHFRRGQAVRFQVVASDGFLTSAPPTLSDVVTVVNTPPNSTGTTLTSSDPRTTVRSTLTCAGQGFSDVDADPVGWQWRWQRDGVDITGASSASLAAPDLTRGDQITCAAAAWDGSDLGPWLSTLPIEVRNAPPTVASAALSTYSPQEGTAVTASHGATADPDGDGVDVSFQWYVNGVLGPTGAVLSPLAFTAGDTVWVVATPFDGIEPGPPVTSPSAVVNNSPPRATSVDLRPTTPTTTQTLIATPAGEDADGHSLTWTYVWTVDGVEVQRSTASTLPPALSAKGDVVRVTAIPNDGYVDGASATSSPVTIVNTPPSLDAASLGPSPAYETTTLTCGPVGYVDADADAARYTTTWTVNGSPIAASTATLTGAWFDRDDVVRCTIVASDGEASAPPVQSPAVSVLNTAPTLSGVTLSTLTPSTATTLTATALNVTDADADPVELRWTWRVNGSIVSADPTLPPAFFSQGDLITVSVRPWDGTIEGVGATSEVAVVQNARPVVETLAIEPDGPTLADDPVAVWTASDADADPLTSTFTWTVDGVTIAGVSGPVLDRAFLVRGAEVSVTLVVNDGLISSLPVTSLPVIVENTPPVATSATVSPQPAFEGSVLTCVPGPVSDAEGDPITWFYLWRINGIPLSDQPTIDGALFDRGATVSCAMAPSDGFPGGVGATVVSPLITIQNSPPVLASASLSTTTPVEATTLSIIAGARSDADRDLVTLRYAWLVNGVLTSAFTDTFSGAHFRKGDTVQARVTPWDGSVEGTPVFTNIATVQNTPPSVVSLLIAPSAPTLVDTLTASAVGADVDGDSLTWRYDWLIDGVVVQSGPQNTLAPGGFVAGQRVWAVAVANDGVADSASFAATPVRIENSPPTMTSASISPSTIFEPTTATCTPFGWFDADGDSPGYQYRWLVNGVLDVATQTITGIRFRKGDQLVCRVTPWDGISPGVPVDSAPVVVSNSPPVLGTVTLDRTAPTEGSTVGVIIGSATDADNDPLTTTYQWFVNGAPSVTTPTISGASFRKGDRLSCQVTVSDLTATATALSNEVTVVNSLPVVNTLSIAPVAPDTVTTVNATFSTSDADGDTVTVSFEWLVNGVPVPGVTGPSLSGAHFIKHQTIQVRATPFDGTATGGVLSSNIATAVNTAPVAASISVTGRSLTRASSLRCTATGLSDLDGDTVVSTTQWFVNGLLFTTSDTLNGATLTRGQTAFCTVRPFDGEEYGNAITSTTYTVANSLPTIGLLTLVPAAPKEGDVVSVSIGGVSDADGDPVNFRWSWTVNGVVVSTLSSIDSSMFSRGQTIQVAVTPNDTIADGPTATTTPVVVVNAPPVVTALPGLIPSPADKRSPITASGLTGMDPDGDSPITWTYQWYVNGALVQQSTSNVLGTSMFSKGQSVYVAIYGFDGIGTGAPVATPPITIQNAPPTMPSISFTPTIPVDADPLTCSITAAGTDADGDSVVSEMKWVLNGVDYGIVLTTTTITLRADQTQIGQVWKCAARSFDGTVRSGWREVTRSIAPIVAGRESCADLRAQGATRTGWHGLDDGAGGAIGAWCDQSTLGGGWTRLIRTEGAERDWGQATWDLVTDVAPHDAPEGVYAPFDTVRQFRQVLLRQTDGAQAGRWAAFELYGDNDGLTMRELLETCRDQAAAPGDDAAFLRPAVVGHTSFASGEHIAGDLTVYDRFTGLPELPGYVHLCGVSQTGDNDVSYLAFTTDTGQTNDWVEGWWGPGQPGTLWSFASGPYTGGHLGTEGIVSFAGWKGAGWPEAMHAGSYEVYVR